MLRFFVDLKKVGAFGAGAQQLLGDLILTPQSWGASDRGGYKSCSVSASGSAESLASICGWLGDRMEIYSDSQELVWVGVLWDVEVSLGGIVIHLSLDNIFNRCAVTYPFQLPDGSEESRTTDWVQDDNSVDHYGKRELLYGKPASLTAAAETMRDTLLTRFASAAPLISNLAAVTFGATLTGQGVWQKASSVYFTNLDGLLEHTGENGSVTIGRYMDSDQISFGTLTPGGEADEIQDAGAGFSPLLPGDTFTLTGATVGANNDTYTIVNMDDTHQISVAGGFSAEAVGAMIRISPGPSKSEDNVAQGFQLTTAWTATHVAVKVKRIGSPSDNFRIGIYPDSSGSPGTVLAANETVGTTLPTELNWVEFVLDTPVALAATTTYYVNMRRTGSANLVDGYEVSLDEDLGYAGGVLRVYDGSAWVARVPDADMPFRVIGEIDSTAQIAKVIDAVDAFSAGLVQVDSGVAIRPFIDTPRLASDVLGEMLDLGTSDGQKLVAWVTPEDALVVGVEPLEGLGKTDLVMGMDGRVRLPNGSQFPPGRLIFGERVDLDSLMLLDALAITAERGAGIYVAESSYDATSGMLTVTSDGALDPFKALTLRNR